ncbi:DUF3311 domain-containing protein [Herbidospora galbida]|uniref:DUF3311 domain-containing protein n=1 Tax=Herbidospora galbida TaxID=2575442 RepID=A0A4U3LNR5_9ACTN|nr:DUF3311 domain-containing protein [Herbidospora galbida]TKK77300.1 DUF3311 domain-containing protein [Herbidospora galbida]
MTDPRSPRSDRSRWNWVLLPAIVVPLIPALFNHEEPRLFGVPLFYWLQLAFLVISVSATLIVYRVTRR